MFLIQIEYTKNQEETNITIENIKHKYETHSDVHLLLNHFFCVPDRKLLTFLLSLDDRLFNCITDFDSIEYVICYDVTSEPNRS